MFDYLAGRLRQLRITQDELGYELELCSTAVSHRMTGRTEWSLDEMYKVLDLCRAEPAEMHIYFPRSTAKKAGVGGQRRREGVRRA